MLDKERLESLWEGQHHSGPPVSCRPGQCGLMVESQFCAITNQFNEIVGITQLSSGDQFRKASTSRLRDHLGHRLETDFYIISQPTFVSCAVCCTTM